MKTKAAFIQTPALHQTELELLTKTLLNRFSTMLNSHYNSHVRLWEKNNLSHMIRSQIRILCLQEKSDQWSVY